MQRTVNMLVGLAVVVGVSVVLFGAIGGTKKSSRGAETTSASQRGGGLPQLEAAVGIVGPSSSEPPPIPTTASFPARENSRVTRALSDPARVVDERWERARRRIRAVFGGALSGEKEAAIQAAVATWVGMQLTAASAYQGGYIDSQTFGVHTGWNRNVYMLALQDALGNDDFQRYAQYTATAGTGTELSEITLGF